MILQSFFPQERNADVAAVNNVGTKVELNL